jgi:hypothetical protein
MLIIGMGPKKGPKDMNPMEKFLGKAAGKPADTEVSPSPLSFSMPPGFKVPDGVKDGESFDAMATLMVRDGKLVLGELDGAPIGDEPEVAPEPEMTPEPEMADEPEPAPESDESEYSKDEAEDAPKDESEDDSASDEDEGLGFLDRIEKKITKKKKM